MQQNMRPITKPDLNSVFESMLPLAKSNPQYINAYLLTGTPEQKLAAAMIKDMPQGQPQAAPAQAPTQTVIDQKAAQIDPGIASLPVAEGMFDGGSYAAGGIIAFDDGGNVPSYASQGEVNSKYPSFGGGMGFNAPIGYPDINSQVEQALQGAVKQTLAKAKAGLPLTQDEKNLLASKGFINPANAPTAEKPQMLPEAVAPQLQKPLAAQPVIDPNKKVGIAAVDPNAVAQPKQKHPPAAPELGNVNYGLPNAFAGLKVPDRVSLDKEAFVGAAPTMSGIQALREEAYKKAGVSEDSYDKVMTDIEAKRGELEGKGKDRALGEFLMNLGFGAAGGTSQNALQNFGQAAGPAGKELIGTMRDLENKKDKLAEREFAVMDARNKFRQTGADSDLRSMQDLEKDYRGAQRDYAKVDAQLQDTQVGRQFSLATNVANENGQNARAALSAKLQEQGLRIQSFNAQTQRMAAEKPELFTTILTNLEADPAYQKATGVAKNKLITDAISDAKSSPLGGGDNTLRAQAGKAVDNSLTFGPIATKYKELLKSDPTGSKAKAFKDKLVLEELQRLKQDAAGSPAASTAGWGQMTVN